MAIKPERVWRFALPYDERKPDLRLCTENQRIAADTHSVEYIRADIHRAVVSERDAARAEVERLRKIIRVIDELSPRADHTCDEPGITLSEAARRHIADKKRKGGA
jgi:hypothetical protein